MSKLLLRILVCLIFWGIFGFVIFAGVPYPNTLTSASFTQLLFFLIPLFFALTFTINITARLLIISIIISLGIILILILKALDILNFVSAGITILAVYLFYSYFQRKELVHFQRKKLVPFRNNKKSKFPSSSKIHNIGLLKSPSKSKLQPLKKL